MFAFRLLRVDEDDDDGIFRCASCMHATGEIASPFAGVRVRAGKKDDSTRKPIKTFFDGTIPYVTSTISMFFASSPLYVKSANLFKYRIIVSPLLLM